MAEKITVEEICGTQFTKREKGYDPEQVDQFLDVVCDVLENREMAVLVAGWKVWEKKFKVVKNGYDQQEVRELLHRARDVIVERQEEDKAKTMGLKSIWSTSGFREHPDFPAYVMNLVGRLFLLLTVVFVVMSIVKVNTNYGDYTIANIPMTWYGMTSALISAMCFIGSEIVKAIHRIGRK